MRIAAEHWLSMSGMVVAVGREKKKRDNTVIIPCTITRREFQKLKLRLETQGSHNKDAYADLLHARPAMAEPAKPEC